eukprot:s175_g7.t2
MPSARPLLPLRSRTAPADLGNTQNDALNDGMELAQSVMAAFLALLLLGFMVAAWTHRQSVHHVTEDILHKMIDLAPAEAGFLIFAATAAANVCCLPSIGLWLGAGVVFAHIYHPNVLEGALAGTLAVFLGLVVGSLTAFTLGRTLCQRCIARRLQHLEWVEVLNAIVATEGWKFVMLARMSPVLPLEAFSYACSFTNLTTLGFALGCFGSLPITFFWVWMGASAESLRMEDDPGPKKLGVHTTLLLIGISLVMFGIIARLSTRRYQEIMDRRIPSVAQQRLSASQEHLSSLEATPIDEAFRQEVQRLRRSSNLRHWRGILSPRRCLKDPTAGGHQLNSAMEKPSTAPAGLQPLGLEGLDPEWIGAKSAMHSDRLTGLPLRRRVVDVVDAPFKHGAATGLALNGFGRYFTDSDGLAVHQGKRHVRPPDGKVECQVRMSDISEGTAGPQPLRSGACGLGPALPTAIWSSPLRSGSAHCDVELAVEVRQGPLRSGAGRWGPAVPTAICNSRLRSGSAQCDLELADEISQCPLQSGAGEEEAEAEEKEEEKAAGGQP